MNAKELYDYITTQMTAKEALLKLLEGHVLNYEKLKFNEGEEIHPVMLISMAAMDIGWQIAIPSEDEDDDISGMVVGTEEYIDSVLNDNNDNPDSDEN